MSDGNIDVAAEARARAYALPLDQLNPGDPSLFRTDAHWPILERLRKEDPVHYTAESEFGPYWSITKYNDIMAVDTNHQVFSSEGGITIASQDSEEIGPLPMFIAMDPPKHDVQRKTVSPAVSPHNLQILEPLVFGDIVLDPAGHTVERAGQPLDLTPLEFDLLACLLGTPEQVFTREVLLQKVWGYHHPGDTKLVNVHMTRLRSKIEDDAENPSIIRTVRGVGYQAIAPG